MSKASKPMEKPVAFRSESIEDALLNKKYVDIPMGRVLGPGPPSFFNVLPGCTRSCVCLTCVCGKNCVAAEAFTGGNYESPQTLKT